VVVEPIVGVYEGADHLNVEGGGIAGVGQLVALALLPEHHLMAPEQGVKHRVYVHSRLCPTQSIAHPSSPNHIQ
jgi:hypothetical protein